MEVINKKPMSEQKKLYMRTYYNKYYQEHKEELQKKYQSEHTGQVGGGRPRKYESEDAHERIKESKRIYARRKAEERKQNKLNASI